MGKAFLLILFLLIFFTVTIFPQKKSADKEILKTEFAKLQKKLFSAHENQCEMYGQPDFEGENISLNVVNGDVREILKRIVKEHNINFVFDNSVEMLPITLKAERVPWNIALDSLLKVSELKVQTQCPIIYVTQQTPAVAEKSVFIGGQPGESPLYTEFVRLKNLKFEGNVQNSVSTFDKSATKLIEFVTKLLTRRGSVEADLESKSLIITDKKSRVEPISDFVKFLDNSGFTIEEFINELNLENK